MSRLTDPSPQPISSPNNRKWHLWIVLAIVAVSSLGLVPHALFYLQHGRGPLSSAQVRDIEKCKGMTRDEVRRQLGEPHSVNAGAEIWYYTADVLGIILYRISFDDDGRVESTWS